LAVLILRFANDAPDRLAQRVHREMTSQLCCVAAVRDRFHPISSPDYDFARVRRIKHRIFHVIKFAKAARGRGGLLAHTCVLGPNGQSNGCVSFKNYAAFLRAYQNGEIKHLAVVASMN
jgi:hypothetical protein